MMNRERLEETNGRCLRLCHEHGHLSPGGNPNVFLLYFLAGDVRAPDGDHVVGQEPWRRPRGG
ncbi:MAG: hypothetical protein OXF93_15190 [Acidobacteria bacterium]|nr:hypothetical protein [Acidobacteriota bacterium]